MKVVYCLWSGPGFIKYGTLSRDFREIHSPEADLFQGVLVRISRYHTLRRSPFSVRPHGGSADSKVQGSTALSQPFCQRIAR